MCLHLSRLGILSHAGWYLSRAHHGMTHLRRVGHHTTVGAGLAYLLGRRTMSHDRCGVGDAWGAVRDLWGAISAWSLVTLTSNHCNTGVSVLKSRSRSWRTPSSALTRRSHSHRYTMSRPRLAHNGGRVDMRSTRSHDRRCSLSLGSWHHLPLHIWRNTVKLRHRVLLLGSQSRLLLLPFVQHLPPSHFSLLL